MKHIEVTSRVGPDGVLTLTVPVGLAEANREVRVIVEPLQNGPARLQSQEQRRQVLRELAGSITDPSFERPEQGDFEERGDLFP